MKRIRKKPTPEQLLRWKLNRNTTGKEPTQEQKDKYNANRRAKRAAKRGGN